MWSVPLVKRIDAGRRSVLFAHDADYAAATTAERLREAEPASLRALHYLLGARLLQAWATALDQAGDTEHTRYLEQRLRKFRNDQLTPFFEPCAVPAEAVTPLPFQCAAFVTTLILSTSIAKREPLGRSIEPLEFKATNVDTNEVMQFQIAKWGNSLALRLPASVVKQLGLCEGLTAHAQVTPEGNLAIQPANWRRSAFAAELDAARAALPLGKPVVDVLRRTSRY